MWVFADLTDDELREFAGQPCKCSTRTRAGVNFRCAAHRAQDELDRREREARDAS